MDTKPLNFLWFAFFAVLPFLPWVAILALPVLLFLSLVIEQAAAQRQAARRDSRGRPL